MSCKPRLGCATTRQLLEEIEARGATEHRHLREGMDMANDARSLIERLPDEMLAYRTVDHE